MFRTINKSGGFTIPAQLRREHGIQAGDGFELVVQGKDIVLKAYKPRCIFCGSNEDVKIYNDRCFCAKCQDVIKTNELDNAVNDN